MRDKLGRFTKGNVPWIKDKHPIAWNKGTLGIMKVNKTSFKKGQKPWNYGIKTGQIPWNWKGDDAGYYSIHDYMHNHFEWRKECEFCGSTKNLDLASKDYSYNRNKDSWIILCHKCHREYDTQNAKWGYATHRFKLIKIKSV